MMIYTSIKKSNKKKDISKPFELRFVETQNRNFSGFSGRTRMFLLHVITERPEKLRFYSVPRSWPLDDLLLTQCWCQALSDKYVKIHTPYAFNLYKRDAHPCIWLIFFFSDQCYPDLLNCTYSTYDYYCIQGCLNCHIYM